MDKVNQLKKLLILVGSPRRNGNSATLAAAVKRGTDCNDVEVSVRFVDDYVSNFLRDCRTCRLPNGECSINDDFHKLFLNDFLNTDGVIFCTPIYWYGLSAQMKAFFDRSFCYYAASYPNSTQIIKKMSHKRVGLVISSEETYPGASLGITHQIQEYSRYTESKFIGVVRGIGNSRGEVVQDPNSSILAAEELGRKFFKSMYSDYRVNTKRDGSVWPS